MGDFDGVRVPAAKVVHSGNPSIASSASYGSPLSWNAAIYDPFGMFSGGAATKLTVKQAGYYRVGAVIRYGVSFAGNLGVEILLNGAQIIAEQLSPKGNFNPFIQVAGTFHAAEADYLECAIFQASGSSRALLSTSCFFYAAFVGW